ncbi:AhpC/TSA family protein [Gramella lutea]|uniref:AhpC/TSA family protein n=1 Tax=Christiangramia lutea TaxID=1607951 RepID=A0A9X1V5R6_9FLAO|nr:TlpA disulfide reductase family protein [Christiangramia lutea]MCH4824628.1 AhpC/TSA family protein [Christiangramia lutea]
MKRIILIILFPIILIGCKNENKKQKEIENKNYQISANITGLKDGSKVLISNATNGKVLDSTILTNGKFKSEGSIENPPIQVNIMIQNDEERVSSFIYIGNENIQIEGNKDEFPNDIKITGSKYHQYKKDLDQRTDSLNNLRSNHLQTMFSLRRENKWNDSLQNAYWSKEEGIITKIDNQTNQITKNFISENINSDYALSQLIIYKTDFSKDFIEKQIGKLNSEYENSEYSKVLKTYLKNEPLSTGDKFYNFSAENQKGNKVNFSDFFEDKYVLLEFYSPYCSWCLKALPEIKKLSKEKSDQLEIVTVNVDKNKEDWLQKYKSNNITWTSLYDENGRYSDVYTKYRVFATPTYYLFDNNGTVVEKWDGYNDNLTDQIGKRIKNGG